MVTPVKTTMPARAGEGVTMRKFLASVCATALLGMGLTSVAAAQQQADGLIVVQIGDITTGDILSQNEVTVQAAVQLAANVCNTKVGPLAIGVLAQAIAVDRSDQGRTVCTAGGQFVRFENN